MQLLFKIQLVFVMTFTFLNSTMAQHNLIYPNSFPEPSSSDFFGTTVQENYRWLEDDTAAKVKDWVKAQNSVTDSYLQKIPYRENIRKRLTELWNYERYSLPEKVGENYFYFYNNGLQNQATLMIQKGLQAKPEAFLNPNTLSEDGTVAIGNIAFSNDSKYMAYTINKSGSDWQEIYVMEIDGKKHLNDKLEWVKFSGMAWYGNGFFYSRYEAPSEISKAYSAVNQNHKVYYHELGKKQEEDVLIYENKAEPNAYFTAFTTADEKFLCISGSKGTSGNNLFVKKLGIDKETFKMIVDNFESDHDIMGNVGDDLFILTKLNAPNKRLVKVSYSNPDIKNAQTVIKQSKNPIVAVSMVGQSIVVNYSENVQSKIIQYNIQGKKIRVVSLPQIGTVAGFGGNMKDETTFFTVNTFLDPGNIYQYHLKTGEYNMFKKNSFQFDFENYETRQVFYKSKDGTKVPMYIVMKKGLSLNGKNPVFLYGYGGFDISVNPGFAAHRLHWLEKGGIYAQANLRGGSEYGQAWHEAGMLLNKQNVFDDFIAAGEYLIEKKYTDAAHLSIYGRSNGGLLVGACMTQRPDLFRVAMPAVGVLDMLRYHRFTIGRAWGVEYGIADDNKSDFKNLYQYSPLHNVKKGTNYPSTLIFTADHDDRVVPAHSFKFAAELQAKDSGKNPMLIRIDAKSGHGAGKPVSKLIDEWTDVYAFDWYEMGFKYEP